jgi:hypothetical protein
MHISEPLDNDEISSTSGHAIAPQLSMMNDDVRAVNNVTIEVHTQRRSRVANEGQSIPSRSPIRGRFEGLEFNNDREIRTTSGSVSRETEEYNQIDH